MIRVIKVQLKNDNGVPSLAGFNSFNSATDLGAGLLSSDLLDSEDNPTGVSLIEGADGFTAYVPALVDGTPDPQYPEIWFERNWYGGSGEKLVLSGLPANTPYTILIPAHNANGRNTVFTVTGAVSAATYFVAADPDPDPYIPNAPVSIDGQTDGSGNLRVSSSPANSTITHLNGFILIYDDGVSVGPSVTTADDITDESQPATFTLSGNENAPTGITINGEAGSNITFVSENTGAGTETYSYEPPLIADDDTADLVVSVDGTTAGATIAYANSYDRDQLTHPATEAEYSENSLSYPNAYATTQAYEWKVIADANASVVTIDWDALEADDGFHKDVANYATPVANGVTTVTLGVFVPETGQAYQFDRTITVSDGSVVVTGEGLWRELFRDPTEELFTELFR